MSPEVTCVSCGSARSTFVYERPAIEKRAAVTLDRCAACGLVYQRGWTEVFNASAYDYYGARTEWPIERVYRAINARSLVRLLDDLGARVSGRALVDVGCGAGQLVHVAAAQGWNALGIDLSEPAIGLARRFGANCERVDFFDAALDEKKFDVVIMSELIEHVPSPARFLRRASSLLSDGGIVYLTTPNFRSLSRRALGPRWSVIDEQHVSYFTPASMRKLVLEHTDLYPEVLETRNLSPDVVNKVRSLVRRKKPNAPRAADPAKNPGATMPRDLRNEIEGSLVLRTATRGANAVLRVARAGESLFAILRKGKRRASS